MGEEFESLDEGVARILDLLSSPGGAPPSLEAMRTRPPVIAELKGPLEPVDHVADLTIDGPGGDLDLRLYRPGCAEPPPLLVYAHGGGWVVGDLDIQDGLCRALANRTGCALLSVDYRLAPEHPYPAAADDTWAALVWAAANGAEVGVDPHRLGIAGDSAGGHLAAVAALRARDHRSPSLSVCVMLCPVTDCRTDDRSMTELAEGYFLTRERMAWYWDQYAPHRNRPDRPRAQPVAGRSGRVGAHRGGHCGAGPAQGSGCRLRAGLLRRRGGHGAIAPGRDHPRVPWVSGGVAAVAPRPRRGGRRDRPTPPAPADDSHRGFPRYAPVIATRAAAPPVSSLRWRSRRPASSSGAAGSPGCAAPGSAAVRARRTGSAGPSAPSRRWRSPRPAPS